MTGGERAAADVRVGDAPPLLEWPEASMYSPALAPQREHRAAHPAAGVTVRAVVLEVYRGCGAVILAGRVDRRRVLEAPQVFGERGIVEWPATLAPSAQLLAEEELGSRADEALRQGLGLMRKNQW